MSATNPTLFNNARHGIAGWFQNRLQEIVRCRECENSISPFESHCPYCGQGNPAKVSSSAAFSFLIGFVLLTLALTVPIAVL